VLDIVLVDGVTDAEALSVACSRCGAPVGERCHVPNRPATPTTRPHHTRRKDYLSDPAASALRSTSTEALLKAAYSLTHQMHGQHAVDVADDRARRDLITAEILRRAGA
jgi:hypothetical protein